MSFQITIIEKVPANDIFNWLAPKNVICWIYLPKLQDIWWNPDVVELRNVAEKIWTEYFDSLTNHFTNLRKSIETEGIKNPIKVVTGIPMDAHMNKEFPIDVIPPQFREKERFFSTQLFGGSRVTIAQSLNMSVDCLVYDKNRYFYDSNYKESEIRKQIIKAFDMSEYKFARYTNGTLLLQVRNGPPRKQQHEAIKVMIDRLKVLYKNSYLYDKL